MNFHSSTSLAWSLCALLLSAFMCYNCLTLVCFAACHGMAWHGIAWNGMVIHSHDAIAQTGDRHGLDITIAHSIDTVFFAKIFIITMNMMCYVYASARARSSCHCCPRKFDKSQIFKRTTEIKTKSSNNNYNRHSKTYGNLMCIVLGSMCYVLLI